MGFAINKLAIYNVLARLFIRLLYKASGTVQYIDMLHKKDNFILYNKSLFPRERALKVVFEGNNSYPLSGPSVSPQNAGGILSIHHPNLFIPPLPSSS